MVNELMEYSKTKCINDIMWFNSYITPYTAEKIVDRIEKDMNLGQSMDDRRQLEDQIYIITHAPEFWELDDTKAEAMLELGGFTSKGASIEEMIVNRLNELDRDNTFIEPSIIQNLPLSENIVDTLQTNHLNDLMHNRNCPETITDKAVNMLLAGEISPWGLPTQFNRLKEECTDLSMSLTLKDGASFENVSDTAAQWYMNVYAKDEISGNITYLNNKIRNNEPIHNTDINFLSGYPSVNGQKPTFVIEDDKVVGIRIGDNVMRQTDDMSKELSKAIVEQLVSHDRPAHEQVSKAPRSMSLSKKLSTVNHEFENKEKQEKARESRTTADVELV